MKNMNMKKMTMRKITMRKKTAMKATWMMNKKVMRKKTKINPFPFDSTAGMNFAHGIHSKDISKAPFVWSTLCKYAPKEVRKAYPELDWSITDRYKKEVKKTIGDHVEITSNGTIESNSSDKDTKNLEEDQVEEEDEVEEEVEEDEEEAMGSRRDHY